ncbi:MAG: hypothetical protein KDA24_14555 [Deltaproteobacteria bacterium]|nr:hypothetical protein [Deltaproteobacteria bacterium]
MADGRSRGRSAIFVLVAVVLGLGAVEAACRVLEAAGIGGLTLDDRANYLLGPILVDDEGGGLRTSEYAERWMIPSRLPADEARVFLVGGSFAMGTPYEYQGYGREVGGGMASWIRPLLGDTDPALVNASAGGQSSYRVRRIVQRLLPHRPAGLIVASCNNEGVAPPTAPQEFLHRTATFRVVRDLVLDETQPDDRPLFTPRERSGEAIARDFAANLEAIARMSADAGVPVLFAAPPSNHRMQSARQAGDTPGPQAELMEQGEAQLAGGDLDAARRSFAAAVELGVDNRCPGSLRREIEAVAERWTHASFVDLQESAQELASQGIPGDDLFVDSCHMNWRGYRAMGAALADAAWKAGLGFTEPRRGVPGTPQLATSSPPPDVFVANRRWPPDGTPGPDALRLPVLVGAPDTDLTSLRAAHPPDRVGYVGPWALLPLLLGQEPWLPSPSDGASVELHERPDGTIAVAGYLSQPDVGLLRRPPSVPAEITLRSTPWSPADQPVSIPADRVAGTVVGEPLRAGGAVRLRVR